jgi:hypothetical protein
MHKTMRLTVVAGVFLIAGACLAQDAAFAPAFDEATLDLAQCRQFVNGRSSPADPVRVKRAFGFGPATGNWEDNVWEIAGGVDGEATEYAFLAVFRQPVAIGALSVTPADTGAKGSSTGGTLFYLKADASGTPDPAQPQTWAQVSFASPEQHLRFATLAPGTRTRALLFKDVRVRGPARLLYLNTYRQRLQCVTAAAEGSCEPGEGAGDPGGLLLGKGWSSSPQRNITDKEPARYTLTWGQGQKLSGIFFYSSAEAFRFLTCDASERDPLTAPASAWKPLTPTAVQDNKHTFPFWAYSYHWYSFPPVETAALRVEVTRVDRGGAAVWLNIAAMTALGDRPPQVLTLKEKGPPFRLAVKHPLSGDTAMVIDDARGRRVRNLFAQSFRAEGAAEEAWDLRDDAGTLVPAGDYAWKTITGPQLAVEYGLTPYPNIQNFFPERMPWLVGHGGEHGWLSDHSANWACATVGNRVFFAASMAEGGVTLIECDLDGRRLWGQHDFGAWIGVNQMTADAENLYVLAGDETVHRIEMGTRQDLNRFKPVQGPHRRGWRSAMAARDGKVAFAYTGEQVFDDAATADLLDHANCVPRADREMARLLRIDGQPPGGDGVNPQNTKPQGNGKLFLESQPIGDRNVSVLSFKQPVALGSVVFPWPDGEGNLQIAALKADAPYPPRADRSEDWIPFESSGGPGWNCVVAPPRLMTRAVRLVFNPQGKPNGAWRLDGLRLLNRRFANVAAAATVRVNSGQVTRTGEWDAERTTAVAADRPGVYVMQWKAAQKLAGLAIKEMDGATAVIDVWQGAAGDAPLDGVAHDAKSAEPGWRNVATYRQKRRVSDYVGEYNRYARYLDGYVDFNGMIETRAVRIRITEQWMDNGPEGNNCRRHDGRDDGHGAHRKNTYCMALDSRLCKIMGVAALSPVGDDPPRDPMAYERIEFWDGKTGAFLKELPVRPGWHGLSFAPDGGLYVIEKSHDLISKVDQNTGKLTPFLKNAEPSLFTIGPDGSFYVFPWTRDSSAPIAVYDAKGTKVRDIGKPGGVQAGLWDPQRFFRPHRMCVDGNGSLWVVESQDNPRRIVQYKTDGTFVKEITGNPHYGGGGTIDRSNSARVFHGNVEFELDWARHMTRIRAYFGDAFIGGEPVTRQVNGRTYIATAPLTLNDRQGVATVYLYNEKEGTVKLAAAMGGAAGFQPLYRSDVISLLPNGEVFRDYEFLWSDRNGNGQVDAPEVAFQRKKDRMGLGPADEKLGFCGKDVYYEVDTFLANGVPVYKRTPAPGWPHLRLSDGSWLTLHGEPVPGARTENFVVSPTGEKRWGYPAGGGVSGLSVPGWNPGEVANQLCLIGHETAAGDLGEFFVVNDNSGQWRVWTADGLLAGNLVFHKDDSRARFLGPPNATFGSRLDPVAGRQEQFHGFFTKTDPDNRYLMEIGFTHTSVLEVKGLDSFRRASGKFQVTTDDIGRMGQWEAERARRRGLVKQAILVVPRMKSPAIDGKLARDEWPDAMPLPGNPAVTFRAAYDATTLYLCWTGKGVGPLSNDGQDMKRLFKTGACLDFQIGVDGQADPKRALPVAGDQRVLISFVQNKPRLVLYQPVSPGASPAAAWSTQSKAGGVAKFDRVVMLDTGTAALSGDKDFVVEAAIPLKALGLVPSAGLRLKGDWGILTSDDGHQVKMRAYWSNLGATGTSDEPTEARLEPQHWGIVEFR